MKQKNKAKFFIAKKMIGKRVAVIKDYSNLDHYYGQVEDLIDEDTFLIKNDQGEQAKVSIFDIRNPAQEL